MKVTGNLKEIIGQVTDLKTRVPQAVVAALNPEKWIARAQETAEATLIGLAEANEVALVPEFARTVTAALWEGDAGFVLSIRNSRRALTDTLKAAPGIRAARSNSDLGMGLFDRPWLEFEQTILEWVQTPEVKGGKRLDERDAGKTDEEIAQHIALVLISPRLNDKGLPVGEALTPHVAEFLRAKEQQRAGLSPERVDEWLRAVLAAWRRMVEAEWTRRIRAELRAKKFP